MYRRAAALARALADSLPQDATPLVALVRQLLASTPCAQLASQYAVELDSDDESIATSSGEFTGFGASGLAGVPPGGSTATSARQAGYDAFGAEGGRGDASHLAAAEAQPVAAAVAASPPARSTWRKPSGGRMLRRPVETIAHVAACQCTIASQRGAAAAAAGSEIQPCMPSGEPGGPANITHAAEADPGAAVSAGHSARRAAGSATPPEGHPRQSWGQQQWRQAQAQPGGSQPWHDEDDTPLKPMQRRPIDMRELECCLNGRLPQQSRLWLTFADWRLEQLFQPWHAKLSGQVILKQSAAGQNKYAQTSQRLHLTAAARSQH